MKNRSYLLLCWFVLLIIFSGCSFSKVSYRDLSDISDKRLGILKGVLTEEPLAADYPQASVKAYGKPMELFMDIESGRCDVAVLNEETAIHVISRNSDYALLDTWKTSDEVWYVIVPKNLMDKEVRKKETDGVKEINPGISLEGMTLKRKLQSFGHLMRRVDSLAQLPLV